MRFLRYEHRHIFDLPLFDPLKGNLHPDLFPNLLESLAEGIMRDFQTGEILWRGRLGAGTLAAAATSGADLWFYCMSNYGNLFSFEVLSQVVQRKGPDALALPTAL